MELNLSEIMPLFSRRSVVPFFWEVFFPPSKKSLFYSQQRLEALAHRGTWTGKRRSNESHNEPIEVVFNGISSECVSFEILGV